MPPHTVLFLILFAVNAFGIDFATSIYPVLVKADCAGCHNDNGVASPTRLKFPEGTPSAARLEAFGNSLHVLVDRNSWEKSLLWNKPTNRVPHAGGKRIEPGSDAGKALKAWVQYLAATPLDKLQNARASESLEQVGPILRRLTNTQYNNTIRDLLGDQSRLADQFPPEDFVNGFRNQYQSQNTSPLLSEAYSIAAEKLARKAFLGGDSGKLIPCKAKSFDDVSCRDRFLKEFGRRAFRRPLLPVEHSRYARLFATEAAAKKQFVSGAQIALEAMLQSPNFLLRTENGLDPHLRPYETASKLSYFLWNSMPDDALLNAAAAGELSKPEGVERHARRMLPSSKTREATGEFIAEWLRFDRLAGTVRERRLYPQFSPELTLSMTEETRRLASHLIWENRNFMDFFSAPYTFVNTDLAKLYSMAAPKAEYDRVELPVASQRAGVLGHASFLTMTSKPAETSPTSRGLFIREQFLCQEVPQPPPGVSTNLPPISADKPLNQRDRLSLHLTNPGCASCHTLIDPIGLGLEKFDAIGAYREKQKLTIFPGRGEKNETPKRVELDLDTNGSVIGLPNSAFSSPGELGIILAASPQCQQCVVKQLFRYMSGRHEAPADRVVLERAFEDFQKSGFQFQELMISLARWSAGEKQEGGNGRSSY
ncbi:MAG TPA: DUF1592 domain-containing protein [Bryobacteraceae bacterium]|nr:DUF1592 domain-containing protein [Bryobacteraceae bacterium]